MHTFYHTVMVHCRERGDMMIVGDQSHLHIFGQGGSAQVRVPRQQTGPLRLFVHIAFIDCVYVR